MTSGSSMAPASKGLAPDDLRLAALALLAETPRHGYEIVKLIEEKTADWYSPSPSIIYPTLNNLLEAGYLTASADPPRLFTITDDGRTYLKQNRDLANGVLDRLTALGERVSRWRRALAATQKPSTRFDGRPEQDADSADSLVEILARAADNSQRK